MFANLTTPFLILTFFLLYLTVTFIFEVIFLPAAVFAVTLDKTLTELFKATSGFFTAPEITGFFVSTTLNVKVLVFEFPKLSFTLNLILYFPNLDVLILPTVVIFAFFFVRTLPALSFTVIKSDNLTFVPYSIVFTFAVITGLLLLYGFLGSGSVGSQSVNLPFVIGVNEGLLIGSSFFVPLKITTFVPNAQ